MAINPMITRPIRTAPRFPCSARFLIHAFGNALSEKYDQVDGSPFQRGESKARRPVRFPGTQKEIARDQDREHGAFDHHHQRLAPPHNGTVPKDNCRAFRKRQARAVAGSLSFPYFSLCAALSRLPLGPIPEQKCNPGEDERREETFGRENGRDEEHAGGHRGKEMEPALRPEIHSDGQGRHPSGA